MAQWFTQKTLEGIMKYIVPLLGVIIIVAFGLIYLGGNSYPPKPTPIYIILPDTTRLHLNSFNWRCTIEGATLEERSYPGSRSI